MNEITKNAANKSPCIFVVSNSHLFSKKSENEISKCLTTDKLLEKCKKNKRKLKLLLEKYICIRVAADYGRNLLF